MSATLASFHVYGPVCHAMPLQHPVSICIDLKTKIGRAHRQWDGTMVHGYRCVAVLLLVLPLSDWFLCGHVPP